MIMSDEEVIEVTEEMEEKILKIQQEGGDTDDWEAFRRKEGRRRAKKTNWFRWIESEGDTGDEGEGLPPNNTEGNDTDLERSVRNSQPSPMSNTLGTTVTRAVPIRPKPAGNPSNMTLEETTIRRSKRERREAKVWEPEIPVKTCRRHHETSKTTVTRRRSSAKGKESENGKGKLRVRVYCARMAVQTESSGPKTRTRRKASMTEQRWPVTWEVGVSSPIDETYRENEGKLGEMATDTNGPDHISQQPQTKGPRKDESDSQEGPCGPKNGEGIEGDRHTTRQDHWIRNNQGLEGNDDGGGHLPINTPITVTTSPRNTDRAKKIPEDQCRDLRNTESEPRAELTRRKTRQSVTNRGTDLVSVENAAIGKGKRSCKPKVENGALRGVVEDDDGPTLPPQWQLDFGQIDTEVIFSGHSHRPQSMEAYLNSRTRQDLGTECGRYPSSGGEIIDKRYGARKWQIQKDSQTPNQPMFEDPVGNGRSRMETRFAARVRACSVEGSENSRDDVVLTAAREEMPKTLQEKPIRTRKVERKRTWLPYPTQTRCFYRKTRKAFLKTSPLVYLLLLSILLARLYLPKSLQQGWNHPSMVITPVKAKKNAVPMTQLPVVDDSESLYHIPEGMTDPPSRGLKKEFLRSIVRPEPENMISSMHRMHRRVSEGRKLFLKH